jgi:hypothetical protein
LRRRATNYLRTLPAPIASSAINFGLQRIRREQHQLFADETEPWTVHAIREPVHADRGSENGGESDRCTERHRLPQKWTPTEPRNLRVFSEFGGCLVHERTATFCGVARRCHHAFSPPAIPLPSGTISGTIRTRSEVA